MGGLRVPMCLSTGVYSSRGPSIFPQPLTRGMIILPYVQKNFHAFGTKFQTFRIVGVHLQHNCQLLTIFYGVDPPHY